MSDKDVLRWLGFFLVLFVVGGLWLNSQPSSGREACGVYGVQGSNCE